jgi:hypothetical protein
MNTITKKVAISIPSEGHTLPEAYDNHLVLSFHLGALQERWKHEGRPIQYEFYWFTTGRLLTALAREKLMEQALAGGMDYIFMYDDDMILPIDTVEHLLADMEEHPEMDVVAPLAFMRNAPHYAVIYTTIEGYDQETHRPYFINNFVKNYPKDTLTECDAVGFGAVLIKLEMVRKMKAPYFFSTTGSGEDIYFCMKSRQEADARIFMDTRVKLGHIGKPVIIDEEYFEKWVKENKHPIPDVPHKYLTYER